MYPNRLTTSRSLLNIKVIGQGHIGFFSVADVVAMHEHVPWQCHRSKVKVTWVSVHFLCA